MTTRTTPTQPDYAKKIYQLIVALLALGILVGGLWAAWVHQQAESARVQRCVAQNISGYGSARDCF
jgi:hypothetical protein